MKINDKIIIEKKISKMFTIARTFAILTVISAHTTIKTSEYVSNFYSAIGSIGVVLFFIMSGYYYKKEAPIVIIKKKTVSVIIPWLIVGTLVWGVNTFLNKSGFTPASWIKWILGYKTYLYFIVMLLLCFAMFYFSNTVSLICAIGVNIISVLLTYLGILDKVIYAVHITNYLNIFNWCGFFALGMLLRRWDSFYKFIKHTRIIFLSLSITSTILITVTGYKVGYFSALGWVYELISSFSILGLCTYKIAYNKLTDSISKMSYAIYLLHMMFIGLLAKIYGYNLFLSLFANIIVLAFTYLVLLTGKYISRYIKLEKVYSLVFGLRGSRYTPATNLNVSGSIPILPN